MAYSKNKKKKFSAFIITAVLFGICIAAVTLFPILNNQERPQITQVNATVSTTAEQTTTTEPEIPIEVSRVTIGSAGDLLIHLPILDAAYSKQTDAYDFSDIFTYSSSVIKSYDYFIANLEVTLGGTENGRKYTGYPCFNSPDSLVTAIKKAGVDCLLTANNHCYDTASTGVTRTQQIISEQKLDHTGTRTSENAAKYLIKEVGGIKFGMLCYTYETEAGQEGRKALNGILVSTESAPLINSFDYYKLDSFYDEIKAQLSQMKKGGAEVSVAYLHWGDEYHIKENSYQREIAQKLCDLGVDVIIGGHPHVVQPVELLTSTDGQHKTVCVYSMGNFVSNQRRERMGLKTGHTEDGIIFEMTFSKYSDGSVVFEKIKVIPTWVHLYTFGGKKVYNIVPLSKNLDDKAESLGLNKSSNGLSLAKGSYERTMELVSEGVKECNDYLSSVPRPDEKTEKTTGNIGESKSADEPNN